MRAVVPIPDHPFYVWQAIVQAVELTRRGWDVTYLAYLTGRRPSAYLTRLGSVAPLLTWQEWRTAEQRGYNAAMKPWLVGRWLDDHPDEIDVPFLLMDPDVIPTGVTEFPRPQPQQWYGTDTDSYTGPTYIQSKGNGLWVEICGLVGVNPKEANRWPGIGAQYTAIGQPGEFWTTVAEKSVALYRMVTSAESLLRYTPKDSYPIQAWAAEMYVMQLEMIRREIRPVPSVAMSMTWADGHISDWDEMGFFHDAGQTKPNAEHFHKGTYQHSPWRRAIKVSPLSASAKYVEMIKRVERQYPRLIW